MTDTAAGNAQEPLIVELVRLPLAESRHVVHGVVVDTAGGVVRAWGDVERLTHPRSAVKPLQALPLVETGAADAYGLTAVELALACASHNGEPGHVEAVDAWLERIECSHEHLECGVEAGRGPTASGNNCSGKHAGFLTVARHLGVDPTGYIRPGHAVQRLVTAALAGTTGSLLDQALAGVDGCGIPVHPVPLRSIAFAAARFGAPPEQWAEERRGAARRLGSAMAAEPWLVAGTDRLCTDLLADAGGDVLVKVGAEGVQFAALPRLGLGIALKAEDGSRAASEVALGHVLAAVEGHDRTAVFGPRRRITNHVGTHVADLVVRPG
jgi:L-asparaginase II